MKHNREDIIQVDLIESDSEVAEELEILPCDYYTLRVRADGSIDLQVDEHVSQIRSNNLKGDIGEAIAQAVFELTEGTVITKSQDKVFDLHAKGHWLGRIEVKFAVPRNADANSRVFRYEFWLNRQDKRKNYAASCTFVICVGINHGNRPDIFVFPPYCEEIRNLKKKVTVPVLFERSKYKKYHYPLNGRPFPEALRKAIEDVARGLLPAG